MRAASIRMVAGHGISNLSAVGRQGFLSSHKSEILPLAPSFSMEDGKLLRIPGR